MHAVAFAVLAAAAEAAAASRLPPGGAPQTVTIQWTLPADGVLEGDPSYLGTLVARTSDGAPHASFEVVMDEAAGGAGLVLERVANDGTTVLQAASAVGTGGARSLRWANDLPGPADLQYVRVRATGCGTACGPADGYRLRAYETTIRVPRFNNTNGQGTVLFLQNRGAVPVHARAVLWLASGTALTAHEMTVPAHGLVVVNTADVPGGQDASGSVTITHDAGYDGLAGKAALVDPVNGFSFDAAATSREP